MAKLTITLTRLEEWIDGIVYGAEVTFKAVQSGVVLIEDTVSGKSTAPYSRSYDVEVGSGDIVIEHNRQDLHYLNISASIEG